MERTHSLTSFSDDELLRRLSNLLGQSRRDEADLVAHIGEVDRRRLYAREASPSMFSYCTEVLHLSEAEAYLRIAAARASREHPVLLTMLADGRLHLTAVAKLAPHLTLQNREALLERATHRSKREIEELVADLSPRPDAPAVMRKLPDRRNGMPAPALRLGPEAEAASRGLRPEGGASVGRRTASGRSCRARARTASGRSCRARARTASGRSCRAGRLRRTVPAAARERHCPSLPRPDMRWSRRSPQAATRSSSLLPPSFATSSSDCGPSCAPRCPTATWPRSSSKPLPRSSKGSKPGASLGPRRRGRRSRGATPTPRRARSRPR